MNVTVVGATTTELTVITYTCTNGTLTFRGTIAIGHAQSIEQTIGGVPAGSGYTCTLTASDSAGDSCSGTVAPFSVMAGAITNVISNVTCVVPTDAAVAPDVTSGPIVIDASPIVVSPSARECPGIESFSISPVQVLPPQTAALTSVSTPGSAGTKTVQWSTDCAGATIVNPTSEAATFSCGTTAGAACHVTLTVGLIGTTPDGGSAGQVCTGQPFSTMTASVVCEACLLECPPGYSFCGSDGGCNGFCANLNGTPADPDNCGSCGTVCPVGLACVHSAPGGLNACKPPPPTPCTSAPCSSAGPNSVLCTGNTAHNQVCTPTEAAIVNQDITLGKLTKGQLDPNTSCYECLVSNGGLDDDLVASDQGNECGDVPLMAGTLTGETGVQACLDTLNCMILQGCDTGSPPALCFCGTAAGTSCLTPGAANGPCLQNEVNGFDVTTGCPAGGCGTVLGNLVEGDPSSTIKSYTNKSLGSGMANSIGSFAAANCASQCGSNF
jgi:hypothetical protein